MFVDLDWPLNASSLLSASAELLVCIAVLPFWRNKGIIIITCVAEYMKTNAVVTSTIRLRFDVHSTVMRRRIVYSCNQRINDFSSEISSSLQDDWYGVLCQRVYGSPYTTVNSSLYSRWQRKLLYSGIVVLPGCVDGENVIRSAFIVVFLWVYAIYELQCCLWLGGE